MITYSDNNKKACLIMYLNLEMDVQIRRKLTSVLKSMLHALEMHRGNLSVGGRHLIQWSDPMPRD